MNVFRLTVIVLLLASGCERTSHPDPDPTPAPEQMTSLGENETVSFNEKMEKCDAHWDTGEEGTFLGVGDIRIKYKTFLLDKAKEKGAIVFCSGRTECMLKYRELIYDLNNKDYSVYIYDHRGQGFSERILKGEENHQKGYVEEFENYVIDLDSFVQKHELDKPNKHKNLFLLAHSMGGAISARYLETKNDVPFQAAILCAPMLGIKWIPQSIISPVLDEAKDAKIFLGVSQDYVMGAGNYKDEAFKPDNKYTHSRERYDKLIRGVFSNKNLIVGGPTKSWLNEAVGAARKSVKEAEKIKVPVLVIQAGSDAVVENKYQRQFFDNLPESNTNEFKIIDGAYHELFMEDDQRRTETINHIQSFMEKTGEFPRGQSPRRSRAPTLQEDGFK